MIPTRDPYVLRALLVLVLGAALGAQPQVPQVFDFKPGPTPGNPQFVAVGSFLYIAADTGQGRRLHRLDTVSRAITVIRDAVSQQPIVGVQEVTVAGAFVFFKGNPTATSWPTLYSHDRIAGGDVAVQMQGGNFDPINLAGSASLLYCSATGQGAGRELWVSNGTPAGTRLVRDINPGGADSNPRHITPYAGGVVFEAHDGTNGREPWTSDGVSTQLHDLNPSSSSDPDQFTVVGSACWFAADDGAYGRELWRATGLFSGAARFDLRYGIAGSNPTELAAANGSLYFAANGGIGTGTELWRATGSTVAQVVDLRPGSNSSNPAQITAAGELVYFTATASNQTGLELFVYDPRLPVTATNPTNPLELTLGPGSANGVRGQAAVAALGAGGAVVFEGNDGSTGYEPWTTRGATVDPLVDIAQPGSSNPDQFTVVNGELFFIADDQMRYGRELWGVLLSGAKTATWSVRGSGCARRNGTVPTAALSAAPVLQTTVSLVTSGAAAGGPVVSLAATSPGALAFGACTLWLQPGSAGSLLIAMPVVAANASGTASLLLPIPGSSNLLGVRILFQSVAVEGGGAMLGVGALSNAIDLFLGR